MTMSFATPHSLSSLLSFSCLWLVSASGDSSGTTREASPQNARIAFAAKRDGRWDIYDVSASGGTPTRLTSREEQERFPVWSPDGTRISFASEGAGNRWELWVMDTTGGNLASFPDGKGRNCSS